jgi:hypothetical protein
MHTHTRKDAVLNEEVYEQDKTCNIHASKSKTRHASISKTGHASRQDLPGLEIRQGSEQGVERSRMPVVLLDFFRHTHRLFLSTSALALHLVALWY